MEWHLSVPSRSGQIVVHDVSVRPVSSDADLEELERAAADGQLLFWRSLDDETLVRVVTAAALPADVAGVAVPAADAILELPTGTLRVADAGNAPGDIDPSLQPSVPPGRYRIAAWLVSWPDDVHDRALRRAVGPLPIAVRDALGVFTLLLGAATVIGVPVFLIGRALDGGWSAVAAALALIGLVLVPVWLLVVVGWRAPGIRRVDEADAAAARRYPDAVVLLERISDPPGAPPAVRRRTGGRA